MPWDPQLRSILPVHLEVMAVLERGADGEFTIDDDPPPDDPVLAAYLAPKMPKMPGFEQQEILLRKLQENGLLRGAPKDSNTSISALGAPTTANLPGVTMIDPMRGVNMPK